MWLTKPGEIEGATGKAGNGKRDGNGKRERETGTGNGKRKREQEIKRVDHISSARSVLAYEHKCTGYPPSDCVKEAMN